MEEYRLVLITKYKVESVVKDDEGNEIVCNIGTYSTEAQARQVIADWTEHDKVMNSQEFAE